VSGTTYSVWLQGGTVLLANTELDGPVQNSVGPGGLTCVDCYNKAFAALSATCP
jgi:hypothetical protein